MLRMPMFLSVKLLLHSPPTLCRPPLLRALVLGIWTAWRLLRHRLHSLVQTSDVAAVGLSGPFLRGLCPPGVPNLKEGHLRVQTAGSVAIFFGSTCQLSAGVCL